MTNEDFVFDGDSFADKGMALDLASRSDDHIFLNFHETTDPAVIANRTAVEVNKAVHPYVFPELDVLRDPEKALRVRLIVRYLHH